MISLWFFVNFRFGFVNNSEEASCMFKYSPQDAKWSIFLNTAFPITVSNARINDILYARNAWGFLMLNTSSTSPALIVKLIVLEGLTSQEFKMM